MTEKRNQIAIEAMHGLTVYGYGSLVNRAKDIAKMAYEIADAMIEAERNSE